jgi:hypothetical protein
VERASVATHERTDGILCMKAALVHRSKVAISVMC